MLAENRSIADILAIWVLHSRYNLDLGFYLQKDIRWWKTAIDVLSCKSGQNTLIQAALHIKVG